MGYRSHKRSLGPKLSDVAPPNDARRQPDLKPIADDPLPLDCKNVRERTLYIVAYNETECRPIDALLFIIAIPQRLRV